jgi:hypothetical protein
VALACAIIVVGIFVVGQLSYARCFGDDTDDFDKFDEQVAFLEPDVLTPNLTHKTAGAGPAAGGDGDNVRVPLLSSEVGRSTSLHADGALPTTPDASRLKYRVRG